MNFYENWITEYSLGNDTTKFITTFLSMDNDSTDLINISSKQANIIFNFLCNLDIDILIDHCKYNETVNSKDVFQFSSIDFALFRLPLMVSQYNSGLTFKEIGEKSTGALEDIANLKYGENHSKLAESCSFVYIIGRSKRKVLTTCLGLSSTSNRRIDIYKVASIMLLRNKLVQNIICRAKNGNSVYADEVSFLSASTIKRRKSNVRSVLKLIFKYSNNKNILKNIKW